MMFGRKRCALVMSNNREDNALGPRDNQHQDARRSRAALLRSSSSVEPKHLAGYRHYPSLHSDASTDETDHSEFSSNDEAEDTVSGRRRRRKQDYELPTKRQMIYGPICILLIGALLATGNFFLALYLNGYYRDHENTKSVYVLRPLPTKPPTVGQMLDPEVIEFVEEEVISVNESNDVAFRHPSGLIKDDPYRADNRHTNREPSTNETSANSTDSRHLLVIPPFSLQPHIFCHKTNGGESTTGVPIEQEILLVMVTDPEDITLRNEFRVVWNNYLPLIRGDLMFVLATPQVPSVQAAIKKESEEHEDMLQLSTMSSGQARYLKTLAAMQWTTQHCPHIKFFVRMNVDVLVQIESFRAVIDRAVNKGLHQEPVIIGDVIGDEQDELSIVITRFPKFVYGGFYLVSNAALPLILHSCTVVPPPSLLEEMYLTGYCAERGHVQRIGVTNYEMERELKLWRKMFSCLPAHVLSVNNVGKENVLYYWQKAIRAGCYVPSTSSV